jgi:RNA polymerase sigma-B factor
MSNDRGSATCRGDVAAHDRFVEYRRTGDRALRNTLVEDHAPIGYACARRFANRSEPLDDLQQVALLGILKAVERFDPERGVSFASFAVPTVLGELRRHFRDKGWMVRLPRRLQELHLNLGDAITELSQRTGRVPTAAELAQELGVSEDNVLEAMDARSCYRPSSIDTADTEAAPVASRLGAPDHDLVSADDRTTVASLLDRLSPREQRVVYLRYFEDRTQSEIAEEIGVSQMHVSRLLARSLSAMRGEASGACIEASATG